MIAEGKVGAPLLGEGSAAALSFGRNGALRTQNAHAKMSDPVMRNRMFYQSTAAAGVAPGTAASTTPPSILWNPPNSGVVAAINRISLAYVSGTLGAGVAGILFVPNQTSAPTGGTTLVAQNAFLGNAKPQCVSLQGSTLGATPTLLRPVWTMGPALATTAAFPYTAAELIDGSIVVPPGVALCLQGIALGAGTSPLVMFGINWEEIPIIAA